MHAAMARHDLAPYSDTEAHCIAAGLIAWYCSSTEAWMGGYGKELRDLFSRGDAQWRDLKSARRGIRCARLATTQLDLVECCAN